MLFIALAACGGKQTTHGTLHYSVACNILAFQRAWNAVCVIHGCGSMLTIHTSQLHKMIKINVCTYFERSLQASSYIQHTIHVPGAYEGKERISHIDIVVISKHKVIFGDSHAG